MSPHNSSTSSSSAGRTGRIREILKVGIWLGLFLLVLDVAVNHAFPYPRIEAGSRPGSLQQYFEYGRSVEGKLPRMVGPTDETTTNVAFAGWLDPARWSDQPTAPATADGLLVAVYGMSHAIDVAVALMEVNPKVTLRGVAGPAAPPNHSYCAYLLDRDEHQADVVIMGILASSLRAMTTQTGLTWHFERPTPYIYPRYVLRGGTLEAQWPPIRTLDGLRDALLRDEPAWQAFTEYLEANDEYYSPVLFEGNVTDRSVMVRMVRRAWAQHRDAVIRGRIHGPGGFREDAPFVPVLKAIVTDFAATARQDGRLPVVLVINNRGYDDHLYRLLNDTLRTEAIPFVSTHQRCPATNPRFFVSDGHFTHEANRQFGEALHELIQDELGADETPAG